VSCKHRDHIDVEEVVRCRPVAFGIVHKRHPSHHVVEQPSLALSPLISTFARCIHAGKLPLLDDSLNERFIPAAPWIPMSVGRLHHGWKYGIGFRAPVVYMSGQFAQRIASDAAI
jgi:hypothetical protein